ncbi:30S ribosomal protein S1 [Defluviicoccus vanus]|uniref:30S ribosomal protein S1 n=1 Tax=Defluviicoccus vanus TaxID=111831 RepID=UPI001CBA627D|nr:30S ribosomal protein S1 [Defluviicoccus vanus]
MVGEAQFPPRESFESLLEESLAGAATFEGRVVKGTVVAIENDMVMVDVGLKSEGRVPLKEFFSPGQDTQLVRGDAVEVYVERFEDKDGAVILSREKARREEAWNHLERAFKSNERINGVIFGRVKGGFIVDLAGAVAFLPGSQVDIRPVRDITPLMNTPQPFQILKMDRTRNNIVVSRRAVLEETRAEARSELIANLREGQILEGVVKNITDYGAFVDLGGVDGLLHVTDISWKRINHPTEALQIGETVKVQVIRFNPETQRISLGMKQLEADPWEGVDLKYPVGARFTGRVTNITDYGAFIELEPGVEGLVHVSEMSWTKKNVHPGKIVSTSQEVEVVVLDVDRDKRRISLGLKQCLPNPWEDFVEKFPVGSVVDGEVKNITDFGLFVGLTGEIDGMVHLSDLSWELSGEQAIAGFKRSDQVRAKVLDVDVEKERISLGIKQLIDDPFESGINKLRKGAVVTCTVSAVLDNAVEVRLNDGIPGVIRKSELSRDRVEQRPDRFATGEKVDAKIIQIDHPGRKVLLSIKARELDEEKQAVATYGSSDSGASLGEILGAAIKEKRQSAERAEQASRASDGNDDDDNDNDNDNDNDKA